MYVHLDPVSGLAGDMFIAGCLDLGLNRDELVAALSSLPLPDWQISVTRQYRQGMVGTHVAFDVPKETGDRHLPDILTIISQSQLPEPVKHDSEKIFTLLAEAEGRVHGIDPRHVHFHEVGAIDAILDICAAAFAVWRLDMTAITSAPPPLGNGTVRCEHGLMPVPVPAVAEIVRRHHIPIQAESGDPTGELVTPTGAAILAHFVQRFGPCPLTAIHHIGCGLGSREIPHRANCLRILAQDGKSSLQNNSHRQDRVTLITTHIDDMNPEWYSFLWDRLFEAGALDVAISPITMKKGRPAVRVEIIAPVITAHELTHRLLTHTTSLGVRIQECDRIILPRTNKTLSTPWGEVRIKEANGQKKPEYDDIARIAQQMNWSLPETSARVAVYLATPEIAAAGSNTPESEQ